MIKKRKQSSFEDLISIASMLPWRVGVLLALIVYFVLHHYAITVVTQPTSVTQMGASVASQLGKVLATFGQYLLPLAFLIGAGISAYGHHKRDSLFDDVQKSSSSSALNDMSWQEFEMLVGEAFRRKGYTVNETGGGGADGGVDLVLRKGGDKFLIQCKQWKAYKVSVTTIRELYGVMASEGAVGGYVVTSGVFTQEAKSFAQGKSIYLIDGTELKAMIRQVQRLPQAVPAMPQCASLNMAATTATPSCPKCGSTMARRTAKKGPNPGNAFWGCSNYPQCRGIVSID